MGLAIAYRPSNTEIIVCELTWDNLLWVQCGREMVHIDKMMAECFGNDATT